MADAARVRYSVGAELWVDAEDADEARVLVGNFLDGFPEAVAGHNGDVLMQDVEPDGDADGDE